MFFFFMFLVFGHFFSKCTFLWLWHFLLPSYFKVIFIFNFIILNFVTISLPVNMCKSCKQFLTFIVNGIFGSSYSSVFLKIVIRFEVYLRGSLSVNPPALCLSFCWKQAPLWEFLNYFACFIFFCVNDCLR